MNVILYMAQTPNGFIATGEDDTSFVSDAEWKHFRKMIGKSDAIVVGRKTYEMMQENREIIPNVLMVVLTRNPSHFRKEDDVLFTNKKPKEIVSQMKKMGFSTVLIAGGGILNAHFLKDKLVNEVYLDIEPLMLGSGIPLMSAHDFKLKLKLLGIKKFHANGVQLHYRVV